MKFPILSQFVHFSFLQERLFKRGKKKELVKNQDIEERQWV